MLLMPLPTVPRISLIHSPDTEVLVLVIRRYAEMCPKTTFVTGRGVNQRAVKLAPIFEALCPAKKAAPPVLHAITGADNTGSFSYFPTNPTCQVQTFKGAMLVQSMPVPQDWASL